MKEKVKCRIKLLCILLGLVIGLEFALVYNVLNLSNNFINTDIIYWSDIVNPKELDTAFVISPLQFRGGMDNVSKPVLNYSSQVVED